MLPKALGHRRLAAKGIGEPVGTYSTQGLGSSKGSLQRHRSALWRWRNNTTFIHSLEQGNNHLMIMRITENTSSNRPNSRGEIPSFRRGLYFVLTF